MAVVPRQRKGSVVYYVATFVPATGLTHWERSGTEEREAERLDQRRKREVAAGTFRPGAGAGLHFVGAEASLAAPAAGQRQLSKQAQKGATDGLGRVGAFAAGLGGAGYKAGDRLQNRTGSLTAIEPAVVEPFTGKVTAWREVPFFDAEAHALAHAEAARFRALARLS